jgi:hypothetical protein
MSLDSYLPAYDVREVHSLTIDASPDRVIGAAREFTGREVPLFAVLMGLRSLPSLLRGHRLSYRRPVVGEFIRAGFIPLAERPDELVLGVVGRFWHPSGSLLRLEPSEFCSFAELGWAKGAFNLHALPAAGGATLLTTETRVLCTDTAARRSFGRYWRVIRPGSAAIRVAWLRAIRRKATR